MLSACKLNNKSMRHFRQEQSYQCMMIDLAMLGVITKKQCEMLIGGSIPAGITLPDGTNTLNSVKVEEEANDDEE